MSVFGVPDDDDPDPGVPAPGGVSGAGFVEGGGSGADGTTGVCGGVGAVLGVDVGGDWGFAGVVGEVAAAVIVSVPST